jgi:hypothetical protein
MAVLPPFMEILFRTTIKRGAMVVLAEPALAFLE